MLDLGLKPTLGPFNQQKEPNSLGISPISNTIELRSNSQAPFYTISYTI